MNKQAILAASGLILVAALFFFGRTVNKKTAPIAAKPVAAAHTHNFDITAFIGQEKQKLTASQTLTVSKIENSISRGDVAGQQITANKDLANFWKDSLRAYEPYIYYLSTAAKLENSEKNLTFAAQLILENIKHTDVTNEEEEAKFDWETDLAIGLFEQALQLNPENDNLKIGLGSCYIYGKGRSGNPQETMTGIQQLLSVVKKDSNNMSAQLVLGIGGIVSKQYDKAIERLNKVVAFDPTNAEAVAFLADAYANTGDKAAAVKWYKALSLLVKDRAAKKHIEETIKGLQ